MPDTLFHHLSVSKLTTPVTAKEYLFLPIIVPPGSETLISSMHRLTGGAFVALNNDLVLPPSQVF